MMLVTETTEAMLASNHSRGADGTRLTIFGLKFGMVSTSV